MPLNSRDAYGTQISNGGNNGLLKKRKAAPQQGQWMGTTTPAMAARSRQLYGGMLPGAGRQSTPTTPAMVARSRELYGGLLPGEGRNAIGSPAEMNGMAGEMTGVAGASPLGLSRAASAHIDANGGLPALQQVNQNLLGILQDMRNRNTSLTNGQSAMGGGGLAAAATADPRTVQAGPPQLSGLYARRAAEAAAMEQGIPRTSGIENVFNEGNGEDFTRQILERQGIHDAAPGQGAALYVSSRMNPGTSENPNPMFAAAQAAAEQRKAANDNRKAEARKLITQNAQLSAAGRKARMENRAANAVMNTEGMLLQAALAGNPQAVPLLGILAQNRNQAMQAQLEQQRAMMGFGIEQQRIGVDEQRLADARKNAKKDRNLKKKALTAEEQARADQLALEEARLKGEMQLGSERNANFKTEVDAQAELHKAQAKALGVQEDSTSPGALSQAYGNAAEPIEVERDLPGMLEVLSKIEHLSPEDQAKRLRDANISPRMLDRLIKSVESERPKARMLPSLWEGAMPTKRMQEYGMDMQEWSGNLAKLKKARAALGK